MILNQLQNIDQHEHKYLKHQNYRVVHEKWNIARFMYGTSSNCTVLETVSLNHNSEG